MASIQYIVSSHETAVERLGSVQTMPVKIVNVFEKPTINRVGTYTAAMDQRSGKGTLVALYETFSLDILFSDAEIPEIDEMIFSLMDYQQAILLGTDIAELADDRTFVMTGESWSTSGRGCDHNQLTIAGRFIA